MYVLMYEQLVVSKREKCGKVIAEPVTLRKLLSYLLKPEVRWESRVV